MWRRSATARDGAGSRHRGRGSWWSPPDAAGRNPPARVLPLREPGRCDPLLRARRSAAARRPAPRPRHPRRCVSGRAARGPRPRLAVLGGRGRAPRARPRARVRRGAARAAGDHLGVEPVAVRRDLLLAHPAVAVARAAHARRVGTAPLDRDARRAVAGGRPGPGRPRRVWLRARRDGPRRRRAVRDVPAAAGRGRRSGRRRLASELERFRAENAGWLVPRRAVRRPRARARRGPLLALERSGRRARRGALRGGPGDPSGARRAELLSLHAEAIEDHALVQLLLSLQHRELRARAGALGVALFADLQVGMSAADAWAARAFVLSRVAHGRAPEPDQPGRPGVELPGPRSAPVPHRGRERRPRPPLLPGPRAEGVRGVRRRPDRSPARPRLPVGLPRRWRCRPCGAGRSAPLRVPRRPGARGARDRPAGAARPRRAPPRRRVVTRWTRAGGAVRDLVDAVLAAARERAGRGRRVRDTVDEPYPLAASCAPRARAVPGDPEARSRAADDVYRGEKPGPRTGSCSGTTTRRPSGRRGGLGGVRALGRRHADHLAARLAPGRTGRAGRARRRRSPRARAGSFAELLVGPARNVLVYFGTSSARTPPTTVRDGLGVELVPPPPRRRRGRVRDRRAGPRARRASRRRPRPPLARAAQFAPPPGARRAAGGRARGGAQPS